MDKGGIFFFFGALNMCNAIFSLWIPETIKVSCASRGRLNTFHADSPPSFFPYSCHWSKSTSSLALFPRKTESGISPSDSTPVLPDRLTTRASRTTRPRLTWRSTTATSFTKNTSRGDRALLPRLFANFALCNLREDFKQVSVSVIRE
jgi:hypothetical protein